MSAISDAARGIVFAADYGAIDTAGKINALGLGFQLTGLEPASGHSAPQSVVAIIEVPHQFIGDQYAFELQLFDDTGSVFELPGPTGDPQKLRIAQNVTVERPTLPPHSPHKLVWSRFNAIAQFQVGLPLAPGRGYEWRMSVDFETRPDWAAGFCVPGQAPHIVVG